MSELGSLGVTVIAMVATSGAIYGAIKTDLKYLHADLARLEKALALQTNRIDNLHGPGAGLPRRKHATTDSDYAPL